MESKITLGQTIRNRRKEIGMTIKELGVEVGLSEQAVSQYELDKRIPDEVILVKIAVALKTTALVLLESAGKSNEYIKSFYDTAVAFTKNINNKKPNNEDPQSYYLEQYLYTLGFEIIGDLEEGNIFVKSKIGVYEIEIKDLVELKEQSRSFIEFKFHEIIKKSRKIGK